jgi:hypothetical protein
MLLALLNRDAVDGAVLRSSLTTATPYKADFRREL